MRLFKNKNHEDRALPAQSVQSPLLPFSQTPPLDVTTTNALRVSDAYACPVSRRQRLVTAVARLQADAGGAPAGR
jgi:hypothetical protein